MTYSIIQNKNSQVVGIAAKAGAILFVIWGILHLWVGFEGINQYLAGGASGLWNMLIGGSNAPRAGFQHTTDAMTAHAQARLILNFCIDVAGYGILGIVVAWMIWTRASWMAYFLGVFIIGVADLGFLFSLVTPGIIELNAGSVGGPVIWFIACAITPFGMPKLWKKPD
ncbi:MAG: hypothetical protein WCO44_05985 [Bacteroidota bacterium]